MTLGNIAVLFNFEALAKGRYAALRSSVSGSVRPAATHPAAEGTRSR
jgi:hypothetical protein